MCLNCGCMLPFDDHNSSNNITADDVNDAALENDQSINDTVNSMIETLKLYQKDLGD